MPDPPRRPSRAEPREVVELKELRATQPELASAIDMQLAIVDLQRRVQGRVPLPRIQAQAAWLASQQAAGRPVVRFDDIPLDWTDFRLTFRQTVDVLHRFGAVETAEQQQLQALGRDGHALEPIVTAWYLNTSGVEESKPPPPPVVETLPHLDQVLALAIRPFLARSVEALGQRPELTLWRRGYCPFCGWEPDFSVITPSAERRLICGRCAAQWAFDSLTCPFCANADRTRITSFATRDGRYRVYGCDECKRYLKAYDARHTTRSVMIAVDTIATLPLDAAAMQRGYQG